MLTAVSAMLLAACSSSDELQQQTAQPENGGWSEYVTITAGTPGDAGTTTGGSRRVAVNTDDPQKSLWETGDQLTVWTGDNCTAANMSENGFTLTSGAGEGTAKFSGRIVSSTRPNSDTKLIAVIDKDGDAIDASAGNSVTADLSEQVGASAESALDYELYYATSTNGARNFSFTHKMALIGWTIKVNGVSDGDQCDIVLRGTGLKNSATLEPTTGTLTSGTDDGSITLKDVTLTSAAGTTLYVVLPPGTVSSGIKATLTMTSGTKQGQVGVGSLGAGSITVAENTYYDAGPNEFTLLDNVVDLGLPSGTLWATCNVGATSPEQYGDFFAWGETNGYTSSTEGKTYDDDVDVEGYPGYTDRSFDWASYFDTPSGYTSDSPSAFTTYNTAGAQLQSQHDAATANWGSAWRMPSNDDFGELYGNCYWEWTEAYKGTGPAGFIVYAAKDAADRGKFMYNDWKVYDVDLIETTLISSYYITDTHIFLPARGARMDTRLIWINNGCYWTNQLTGTRSEAHSLEFDAGQVCVSYYGSRQLGYFVRPVFAQ